MSSHDDDSSSVASSSHDRSDEDWSGSEDDGGAKKKKRAPAQATQSGRRQLARRPMKPRPQRQPFQDSSDSNSGSGSDSSDDDDVKVNYEKDEEGGDNSSSAASSDSSPLPKKQQPKKKIQRKNPTQHDKPSSTAKSGGATPPKKSKKKIESDIEEEEWLSEASDSRSDPDSDFGAPPTPLSCTAKKGNNTKTSLPVAIQKKDSTTTAKRTPKSRRTISRSEQQSSDDDDDKKETIQYDTTPSGIRRPRRSCTQQTRERMSLVVKQDMKTEHEALSGVLEDDDKELLENSSSASEKSDDDNDNGDAKRFQKRLQKNKVSSRNSKKRGNKYDDDEDYDENANSSNESYQNDDSSSDENNDNDDDDNDDDFEIGSDDNLVPTSKRRPRRSPRKQTRGVGKKKPNYTEIDEDDIGTADENTSDEETGPSLLTSPTSSKKSLGTYGSPATRKRARAGGRTPLDLREDNGSGSDEDDPSSKKRKQIHTTRKKRPYMDSDSEDSVEQEAPTPHSGLRTTHINCPSRFDDITMMNLPRSKPHVCYIAPDGKSRHCFTLDTLYRIAISANDSSTDRTSSDGPMKFLQPPHFRSTMEDDLIDQIASRFGRSALVIEKSAVYKKIKGGRIGSNGAIDLDELDEFDEDGNFVGEDGEGDGVNFQDRFQRFITTLLGSSDVYCCPLCYIEAYRRLGHQHDDEMVEDDDSCDEDQEDESQVDRFVDDPLTILGDLDNITFEVAATFCFRKLSGVKQHLKVVHGVNLTDIEGNDLFKRFQVRAGDGLLQRWLQKSLRRNSVQGDMMRYWNSGENQSFLLLLSRIDRSQSDYASDFSLSFPNRARKVWNQVSAPYLKHGQDMDDFIADDDESEEGDVGNIPINPHFTPPSNLMSGSPFKSPEEEVIENLRNKNRNTSTHDDSDSASGGKSTPSDEDELEILDPKPTEEESEEDEWTKSKSYNAKVKRRKSRSSTNNDSDDNVPEPESDVEIIEEKTTSSKTPTSARKRILESSDEESY